uniref:Uncharacterized protein n=1 Tax=Globisporangium ultimum (strain ATCC 200006 / CBS 805.95 / DAOM BR144) TaxID=431595 RepID=K3XAA7_GLOUD
MTPKRDAWDTRGKALTPPLLHAYEQLLVHNERFALATVVQSVQSVLLAVQQVKNALHDHAKTAQSTRSQSKRATFQSAMDAIAKHLTTVEAHAPVFLGEQELQRFAKALNEFTQLPELDGLCNWAMDNNEKAKTLLGLLQELGTHQTTLGEAMAVTATICSQLTSKRDHLMKLLDDATQIVENSHSKRLTQLEHDMKHFMESYKASLGARPLRDAKQLEHEVKSIETSMSMMLLPHIEICRTIALAFDGVLNDSSRFLAQLKLFERAASKDAFSVLSSTLKLQFQESLDEELFQAYVDDWKGKKQALKILGTSGEYCAASQRLDNLKADILRMQGHIERSKQQMDIDDPTRIILCHELALLFQEEGRVMSADEVSALAWAAVDAK